jgi:hypothetical protein
MLVLIVVRDVRSGWVKSSLMIPFTPETMPQRPPQDNIGSESDTAYFSSKLFKKDKDYRCAVLEGLRLSAAMGKQYAPELIDMVLSANKVCVMLPHGIG